MIRKTYITRMPDQAGAFLLAGRIISGAGGNIVRVNYNRAVDIHTLFIEVAADEAQHELIERKLAACGYLAAEGDNDRQILMIVLKLPDTPGTVLPVLEILGKYNVNISYISSQENGTGWQHFKMGLLIENTDEITHLMDEISRICEIRILDYEVTDRLLDGTVFYITFANEMRDILSLDQAQTNNVLVWANRIMQRLDEDGKPVIQTFDYIRRFAQFVRSRRGDGFNAQLSAFSPAPGLMIYSIEPPCGSNTHILRYRNELLFVDSGFACYREEMLTLFRAHIPGFDSMRKRAVITHADVDHVGLLDLFETVYMAQSCYVNFELEHRGEPDYREQNPLHEPYCRLSKLISEYAPPPLALCRVIGKKTDDSLFTQIGEIPFGGWKFKVFEGRGGHVKGECVIVCDELRVIFSGDIYVNIRGFSAEQREFNSFAPFLMTGVESVPALSRENREYLCRTYAGYTFCPGHGAVERIG